MNVFTKYTAESLRRNRTRTVVTIIGIILSVAMFTAVTESIVSGRQYLINSVEYKIGSFHGAYDYVNDEQLSKIEKDSTYTEINVLQHIGYAEIGSRNKAKPYVFIAGIDKDFTDMVSVIMLEGRMPEKEGEIVISKHLYTNGRVEKKIGDVLTLEVGQRESKHGNILNLTAYSAGEKLINTKQRTYTVVGICERPDNAIEKYDFPGYTAYTLKENDKALGSTAFFTVANISHWYGNSGKIAEIAGADLSINTDLLALSGVNVGAPILPITITLGAILIIIIILGSIALIYNSFSISISERTKQFGLLRSIGATKKQMIRTVLSEALFLCGIAVPIGLFSGCFGIGITFKFLQKQFTAIVGDMINTNGAVTIKLVPNAYALLAAAVISILTALISAYIPAKRATKMSAIEAIRMSNDIKIKGKQLKTGKLTSKLFGFEGALAKKNFKRNKKKYRTTVVSLTMSLVLFISASSLCYYFQKAFDMDLSAATYDISVLTSPNQFSSELAREIMEEISKTDGIDEYAININMDDFFITKLDNIRDDMKVFVNNRGSYASQVIAREFINDEAFNRLCAESGIDEKAYYDKAAPLALLYDNVNYQRFDMDTQEVTHIKGLIFKQNKFPATLDIIELKEEINGEFCNGPDENGNIVYSIEENKHVYSVEECSRTMNVRVGARLKERPFFTSDSQSVLYYPESMLEAVMGETPERLYYLGYYKAEDYNGVYEKMLKVSDGYGEGIVIENESEDNELVRALMTLVKVFSYGFITLISLIAAANVFNTISTNIMLRRRELAMLKSVGMSNRGFRKMMSYESLLYGIKSILLGLPISLAISYLIYYFVSDSGYDMHFSLPAANVIIALVSVFAVVFASMIYSVKKLKKYNTADELKNENL